MKKEFLVKCTLTTTESFLVSAENMGKAIETVSRKTSSSNKTYNAFELERSFYAIDSEFAELEEKDDAIVLSIKK